VLNVFLFVPLGVGLYLSGATGLRTLAIACALSMLVELAQLFVVAGRDATLGDVIMNTIGASLGFLVALKSKLWLTPTPGVAAKLAAASGVGWLLLQALTTEALVPSYPSSDYYGEVAPSLAGFAKFRGAVRNAAVGDIPISNSRFPSTDAVIKALSAGSVLSATAMPAALSNEVAPVARIADDRQREIAMLGLRRGDFVFRVRTVAATLRLRPLTFALTIPARESTDQTSALTASGQYRRNTVRLRIADSQSVITDQIAVSPALGWALFVPFQWFIRSGMHEEALECLWVALILVPFGYWAGRWSAQSGWGTARARIIAAGCLEILLVTAGLVGLPLLLGLASVSLAEFLLGIFAVVAAQFSVIFWTNRSA
jgi:hypothetical protein